jgi:cytochrome c553
MTGARLSGSRSIAALVALVALASGASGACLSLPDPVHDHAVDRLGPEDPIGPGALHRAGQPCATCHGATGPATSDFSIAGTIFAGSGALVGVEGARIELVDATGASPPAGPIVTNCVGNFWVERSAWDPIFPIRVTVTKGDTHRVMKSDIGRAASCADCHAAAVSDPLVKTGPVTMFETSDPADPSKSCPVSPVRSQP